VLASSLQTHRQRVQLLWLLRAKKERSLLRRSYKLAKKAEMRPSDRVIMANLPILPTIFVIGLTKMVDPLDFDPLEPIVVAVAVAVVLAVVVVLAVAGAKVEAFVSKARQAVGKVGA
jgi:hypothetical protein